MSMGMTYVELLENKDRKRLLDLIFDHNILYSNLSADEILQLSSENPYYRKPIRSNSLKPKSLNFEKDSTLEPNLLYFLSKAIWEVALIKKQQGLWFFSKSDLSTFKYPVNSTSYNFHSDNRFKNFDFLHKHKHPINSIILADDYLFNNSSSYDTQAINLNLKPILTRLLPKDLDEVFHLTIVSGPRNISLDLSVIQSEIDEIFKKLGYHYEFEHFPYNFHKRVILTNYTLITSDKGFRNLSLNKSGNKRWLEEKNDFNVDFIHDSEKNANNYYSRIAELRNLIPKSQNRLLKKEFS